MPRKISTQNHLNLLGMLPEGTTRVSVRDYRGKQKWRELDQVDPSDTILLNKKNKPISMQAAPGRPATIEDAVNEEVADGIRKKNRDLANDPIIRTAKNDPESSDLLHQVVLSLAEEAASLGFERREAELEGRETSQLSVRRVNALKAVAETWLKRKDQTANREIDLASAPYKAVFNFTLDTFRNAMETSGLRPEMIEMVFSRLTTMLQDGWETEARNRMKNAK